MTALTLLATLLLGAAPTPPASVAKAVEAAHKTMKAALLKQTPKAEIELRQESGPFATVIAVAAIVDAYPGSGVQRTVIDATSGTTYGAHGTKTFADFARAHGWLKTLPSSDELVMFLNLALFDGIAIIDRGGDESIDLTPEGLRIVITRRFMPSNAGERLTITVGASGAEVIKREPLRE